jgi:hypothetical protein
VAHGVLLTRRDMHEDLKLRIANDHGKLDRLFEGLETSLRHALAGGPPIDAEFFQDTRDDLNFALEEMFEHFGVEEEAIFAHIKAAIPALAPRVDALEADHEHLSSRTTRLRKMIAAADAGLKPLDLGQALQLLSELRQILVRHNQQEVQIFFDALEQMSPNDRQRLLDDLDHL